MAETSRKKVLLLTLVHPDFLPPVYAIAQVLRDEGYNVHILTFDGMNDLSHAFGANITLESVGKHNGTGLRQRLSIRAKYTRRAHEICESKPAAIISFCAFSLLCGLKVKKNSSLIYHSMELSDFLWSSVKRAPLSMLNNYRALRRLHRADLLATPSVQRSAWLAGRCGLERMPYTILNTVYLPPAAPPAFTSLFHTLLPGEHHKRKIILYMGAVNSQNCVQELVSAFGMVNDPDSVLIVAGMKDNAYCDEVRKIANTDSHSAGRIVFFPFVKGEEKEALQANADIGVCLSNEDRNNVESMMTSPNKVGEYLAKGLYLLSSDTEYMRPLKMKGVAALTASPSIEDIASAMRQALKDIGNSNSKEVIAAFVKEFYCMQQQARPITELIKRVN
jgi:glycosyltransferase involved in cell wall biosynthesis